MREPSDRARIDRFLRELGRLIRRPLDFYLVGGSAVVHMGLRGATRDIDFAIRAEPEVDGAFYDLLPRLKEQLQLNAEPASPAEFLPIAPEEAFRHSVFVRHEGPVAVYYYDPRSLALAKVSRATEQDLADVEALVADGRVQWADVEQLWAAIRQRPFPPRARETPADIERRLSFMRQRLDSAGLLRRPPR